MSHTYASVEEFKRFLIDGGDSNWTASDAHILGILEGASRRVEGYCDRSKFGSGFGPRIGTNKYDFPNCLELILNDDLLTITSVTTHATYGDTGITLTDGTHFIKRPSQNGPNGPFLSLETLYLSPLLWGIAQEGNVVVGTWGYSNETAPLGTAALASAGATTSIITAGTAYAGQTLLVGTEQLYVTASGGTATVVRGVNGTTAAAGTAAASVYRYPREVVTTTLQVAQRRFRSAQAGLTGDFGGGGVPITVQRDTERTILVAGVGHLRRWSAG